MLKKLQETIRLWNALRGGPDLFSGRPFPPGRAEQCLSQDKSRGEPLAPPSFVSSASKFLSAGLFTIILTTFFPSAAALAVPAGTAIPNQATLAYVNNAGEASILSSNIAQVVTAVERSPASVEFIRVVASGTGDFQETVGPSACFQNGVFANLADPVLSGGVTVDPTATQNVSVTDSYNVSEPLFLRLTDSDQNIDAAVIDYVAVEVTHAGSGDTETIQLSETGISTGIFTGYLPTANAAPVAGDCVLQGGMNSMVRVDYTDPVDGTDSAAAVAMLDPVNIVFDSQTGSIVDGASIELIDALTGLPATVYGNDGISVFPSVVTSGVTAADSSGAVYRFGPGEFRFPVVPPGEYQMIVVPPADYSAPSIETVANLQLLPGAPFALGTASFGGTFVHGGALSFNFDVPVDPVSSALFLRKSASASVAAPGDFVRYELSLENSSTTGAARSATIVDQLPPGVRLVAGSVTRDGVSDLDPEISPDSLTLQFSIGNLPAGEQTTISYVVEVLSGKRRGELINRATAYADADVVSNEAVASVQLREDLFRSTATIIGRVLEGECTEETFTEEQGVANVRIFLEDGRYAMSDEGGRFHFDDIRPGRHVAQLDWVTVPEYYEVAGCDTAPAFAGRDDSQFVDLSRGSLKRTDFYLRRKPAAQGMVNIELQNHGTESAEEIAYVLKLNASGDVRIENVDVMVLLPEGVTFVPGTMQVDGSPVSDPRVSGQALNLDVIDQGNAWNREVRFLGNIAIDVHGELVTQARARFDSPTETSQMTPLAETSVARAPSVYENERYEFNFEFDVLSADLSAEDHLQLDQLIERWDGVREIQIAAVGHTDNQRIAPRSRNRFLDNYVLSRARAKSAAHYVAEKLNISTENIELQGRGAEAPVADNATAAGRQKNRHVELVLSGLRPTRPSFLEVIKESSGLQVAQVQADAPGDAEAEALEIDVTSPFDLGVMTVSEVEPELSTLSSGAEIILPTLDFQSSAPVTKISIKHAPSQSVVAYLNDELVSALNFDGTETVDALGFAISRWNGVDLRDGANTIRVEIKNPGGATASVLERSVHFSGPAVRGELVEDLSNLVADGKTRPVIALRLYDKYGKPSRPGSVGTFRVNEPYRSWWDVKNDRKNRLVEIGNREPIYRIGHDGIALIELEPTTQAGQVTLQLDFERQHEQEIRTWLSAAARDWILVGFAEGTVGYNTLSKNKVAAASADNEDGFYEDGRVAFFAKGRIKGEYLLTLSYDTDKDRRENADRFQTQVDPNAYYSLYADQSEQRYETSSQRKLYVKLERNQFFALFGDFDTDMSVTELARYQRRFNGLKSEYHGSRFGYSVFAAETDQSFVRDELRGDGTSGLYRLSNAPLIANSELVRIEVRDRFDTGQVLSSDTLSRFLDYNLDTLDGTLFFKKPIPSRDANFNPVFIVVEYESISASSEDMIAGGRTSLKNAEDTLEVGISHIREGEKGAEADLSGVDFRWQITDTTLLNAEYANSDRNIAGVAEEADAYLMTLEHRGEKSDVRGYVKEVEANYGLGHQSAAESGTRSAGVDGRLRVTERVTVEGEALVQRNLETGTDRRVGRALVRYENDAFSASSGYSFAEDKFTDGENRTSQLMDVSVSQRLFDSDLTIRASGSMELNDQAENADYPVRLVLGADYRVMDGVDLFAEWERSSSQDIEATMTRAGVRASPWSRAQINSSVTNESTEFGPRVFANIGLIQGFQLNDHWLLDAGIDQTNTIVQPDARIFDPDRELSSGSLNEDFLATFFGATYSADLWSANSRVEYRKSDTERRRTLFSGWYREPELGHSLSAGLTIFASESVSNTSTTAADLKLAWAYRMAGGRWSFLDRIDLIFEKSEQAISTQDSWRLINNFNANRRINASSQLSLQYAFKYVKSNFNAMEFSGFTDLVGIDFRRGFKPRWDAGLNASIYHSYSSKTIDYGMGFDVGFNIRDNMWLNIGYNVIGFSDSDFASARYTAQGPFIRFGMKADQQTLREVANMRTNRQTDLAVNGEVDR